MLFRSEHSPSGVINVLVRELVALERFLSSTEGGVVDSRRVSRLPMADQTQSPGEEDGAEMGANMRAVAPPVQSFASGRRR